MLHPADASKAADAMQLVGVLWAAGAQRVVGVLQVVGAPAASADAP